MPWSTSRAGWARRSGSLCLELCSRRRMATQRACEWRCCRAERSRSHARLSRGARCGQHKRRRADPVAKNAGRPKARPVLLVEASLHLPSGSDRYCLLLTIVRAVGIIYLPRLYMVHRTDKGAACSGRVGLLSNYSVEANHVCCSRSSRGDQTSSLLILRMSLFRNRNPPSGDMLYCRPAASILPWLFHAFLYRRDQFLDAFLVHLVR